MSLGPRALEIPEAGACLKFLSWNGMSEGNTKSLPVTFQQPVH